MEADGAAGALSRPSQALGRASRQPSSLQRSSVTDIAASMALGRVSRMRGDGTIELTPAGGGAAAHAPHPPAMAALVETGGAAA